jgi:signal transduction histidine kinase
MRETTTGMMTQTTGTTVMTTETTTTEQPQEANDHPRRTGRFSGIRLRLLGSFIVLLSIATVVSVLVVREVLLNRLDERIDREFVQETQELRVLAGGNDPETGEPFAGRVRKIFRVFLRRNIPSRNEAVITFVDGRPFLRSRRDVPYRLDQDPELVELWARLERTNRGSVDTPAGRVEYSAVPVASDNGPDGVFVVAHFLDQDREETDPAIAGVAATGALVLLIGSLLAWRLAGSILKPVRSVGQTARSISESDLTRRIDVQGRDEISDLASTFNDMLDRLEESFRMQKQFVDDAGHELRTPITIVRGQLETMGSDPDERRRTIALVMDELERMSRLVEDLLLLARSEGPDFLHLGIVDVASLTEEVYAKAKALGERSWQVDEIGKGKLVADRQRVTQALLQLAQNARDHTDPGDVVAIGSRVGGTEVQLWVRDTGPGIPANERERIFDRFGRGKGATKSSGGSGLGLAIVKAITNAHNGRVELESTVGDGAKFTLIIPVDQPEEDDVR